MANLEEILNKHLKYRDVYFGTTSSGRKDSGVIEKIEDGMAIIIPHGMYERPKKKIALNKLELFEDITIRTKK